MKIRCLRLGAVMDADRQNLEQIARLRRKAEGAKQRERERGREREIHDPPTGTYDQGKFEVAPKSS